MMAENEKIKRILDEVLKSRKPSEKEAGKVVNIVDEFISKLNKRKTELGIKAEIMLGGSVAKGTFLRDKFDSDVFFRFDRSYLDNELSELLEQILKPWRNKVRIHGSRDYFQLRYRKVKFELVPVYKITNPQQAVNVTDASPLHVNWIKEQLKLNKHLKEDIILAKIFFKAQRIYGAESYIMGFSGHVTDILVINSGGFVNLLNDSIKWKPKVKIDVMNHGKKLNKSKRHSPLILIDPVQPERNAAAALSKEKFNKLISSGKEFLKNPSISFFEEKKITIKELREISGEDKLIIVNATPLEGKEDIIGCRLLKCFEYLKKNLMVNDFILSQAGWEWDRNAVFWYIIKNGKLDRYKKWVGPPLKSKDHVSAFKRKHTSTFESEGRICARVRRKFLKPEKMIEIMIKDEYIKNKVKAMRMKKI